MWFVDFVKALGVAVATFAITLAASVPMVAFYAFFVEPGHPQEFYNEAAQWIAPWSSHILGPIVFFLFNYWLAKRNPERNAFLFAAATVILYALVDLSTLPMMGLPIVSAFTASVVLSFISKGCGAILGAYFGTARRSGGNEPRQGAP